MTDESVPATNPPGTDKRSKRLSVYWGVGVLLLLASATVLFSISCCRRHSEPEAQAAADALKKIKAAQEQDQDKAWNELLAAMKSGDKQRLAALTTTPDAGHYTLGRLILPGEDRAKRLASTAAAWEAMGVTWTRRQRNPERCYGLLNYPAPAMVGICFRKVQGKWKFAGYIPGR